MQFLLAWACLLHLGRVISTPATDETEGNQSVIEELRQSLREMESRLKTLETSKTSRQADICDCEPAPYDCTDVQLRDPTAASGLYLINAGNEQYRKLLTVYCDMDTSGGGWTVVQKRTDGGADFYRDYQSYADGFGNSAGGEFWLGNENLHQMTSRRDYELWVDIEDFSSQTEFARYTEFKVESSCDGYRLRVSGFSGTARDSFLDNNDNRFSARDRDQDASGAEHCAQTRRGGWWYSSCGFSNLNGLYQPSGSSGLTTIHWYSWRLYRALKGTQMKIRAKLPLCP